MTLDYKSRECAELLRPNIREHPEICQKGQRETTKKIVSIVSVLCEIRKGHISMTKFTACTEVFCVKLLSGTVISAGD